MEDLVGGILGWLGTIGTMTAYVLVSRGWVSADALGYSALNGIGGLLGAAGALTYGAWPALASNLVWGLLGLVGFVGALRRRRAPLKEWVPESVATATMPLPVVGIAPGASLIPGAQLAPGAAFAGTGHWNSSMTDALPISLPWLDRDDTRKPSDLVSTGADW